MIAIFTRRWFKIGLVFVAVGIFSYGLSLYETSKYEAQYPELAVPDHQRLLDDVNGGEAAEGRRIFQSKAEEEAYHAAVMVYGLYGMYRYVGWVFMGIGVLFMLLSFKEPQVPKIEDLDDLS